MQISDSRFHKVWKVEVDQNGRKKVNLGDSKKNQDGTYSNWTWFFCNLVGNAKGVQLNEGDTVTIKSGKMEMYKTNDGQYKNSVTIFDIEVTAKADQQNVNNNYQPQAKQSYSSTNTQANFEEDIPF